MIVLSNYKSVELFSSLLQRALDNYLVNEVVVAHIGFILARNFILEDEVVSFLQIHNAESVKQ